MSDLDSKSYQLYHRGKKRIYQLDYWHDGRHCRQSLKTPNKKIAQQVARKILDGLASGEPTPTAITPVLIMDAAQQYIDFKDDGGGNQLDDQRSGSDRRREAAGGGNARGVATGQFLDKRLPARRGLDASRAPRAAYNERLFSSGGHGSRTRNRLPGT